jgi:transcriptional regulator GlxA family with amidase domain
MAAAARMLRETGRSVADVALAVGYAESASFSRAFTRHFGQGPRASRD